MPSSQWFGSGFGHSGSTSNMGASTSGPLAAVLLSRKAWHAPSTTSTATNDTPPITPRLSMALPLLVVSSLARMLDAGKILVNCLAAAIALLSPAGASAHDIPTDVLVNAFVKPEGQRLRLLVRVPMKALRDVDYPRRGNGLLDLARADSALRNAAS